MTSRETDLLLIVRQFFMCASDRTEMLTLLVIGYSVCSRQQFMFNSKVVRGDTSKHLHEDVVRSTVDSL